MANPVPFAVGHGWLWHRWNSNAQSRDDRAFLLCHWEPHTMLIEEIWIVFRTVFQRVSLH